MDCLAGTTPGHWSWTVITGALCAPRPNSLPPDLRRWSRPKLQGTGPLTAPQRRQRAGTAGPRRCQAHARASNSCASDLRCRDTRRSRAADRSSRGDRSQPAGPGLTTPIGCTAQDRCCEGGLFAGNFAHRQLWLLCVLERGNMCGNQPGCCHLKARAQGLETVRQPRDSNAVDRARAPVY